MSSMPRTLDEWLNYSRDYAPFADPALNQEIIDALLQAGLEEEMALEQKNAEPEALPSILVLPFSNLSGDPEQEYFSDGITDSIIVSLSSFDGLQVKSRHTSNAFRDSPKSIDEIGAELGVRYFVEGSVRRLGDNVRITVQLDDTASGNQVWGKRYDSPLDELFALEEELVQTIAGTVSGRIEHDAKLSSMQKPANDMRAYDYLMRGKHLLEKFNAADIKKAREQFVKCLEIDAGNAEAHTQFAVTHAVELFENWSVDRQASINEAQHHLQQALQLEPENASTHAYYAEHQLFTRDFELGLFHADRAVELNPTLPDTYSTRSYLRAITGKLEPALKDADLSLQIDPYHTYMGWNAGEVYRVAGQYQRAIDAFRSVPHMPPSVQAETAACLVGLGLIDEARGEMHKFHHRAREQMATYPKTAADWRNYWYQITPYEKDEDFEVFYDQLLQAGLCDQIKQAADDMPSIAVLPFENMSGDPEQEHFSDGLTADIIATLSKFQHMRTMSRYSTLPYKTEKPPIIEIAKQQGVRYVLEGYVRKSGNRIRVNAELIDATTEDICWSERYDRELDDLFTVQDEITRNITLAMKVHLDDGEAAVHRSKGATDIKAWELTLTAVDLQDTYIRQNILEARAMVKNAIELDPDYAYAWITLGWTYWQEAYSGWGDSIDNLIEEADKANRHALSLDPDYGEVWCLAGMIHQMKHEFDDAIAACLKAVELEPGSAEAHALTAYAYTANGEYEEARKYEQNMRTLCPIRPNWYYGVSGGIEKGCRNLDLAIEIFQHGLDVEPDSPLCRFDLIDALMEKGDQARARQLADEIRALDKSVTGRGIVHANSCDATERQRFHDNLAKFDLV
jgi:TolB-like protein/Flp pilus assembly protein TadD